MSKEFKVRLIGAMFIVFSTLIAVGFSYVPDSHTFSTEELSGFIFKPLEKLDKIEGSKFFVRYDLELGEKTLSVGKKANFIISSGLNGTVQDRPLNTDFTVDAGFQYRSGKFYVNEGTRIELERFELISRGEGGETDMASLAIGFLEKRTGKTEEEIEEAAVGIIKSALTAEVGATLASYPVFSLDVLGIKGKVLYLAIDDIVSDERGITIEFSLLKLGMNIALFLLLFLVAGAVAIAVPGWVGALVIFSSL